MENLIVRTTDLALVLLSHYLYPGSIAVDATSGNGHDTLALAEMVGPQGKVYAFDLQEAATEASSARLNQAGLIDRCTIIQGSHQQMESLLPQELLGKVSVVVFNLGYLPGKGKEITTQLNSTLSAVKQSLSFIRPQGLVVITMYSGHPEGLTEKEGLLDFASQLPADKYHVAYTSFINQKKSPPELLLITKKISGTA